MPGNPLAFGGRVAVTVGSRRQSRPVLSSRSYASQGAPEIHFGLGSAAVADDLTFRWPTGRRKRWRSLPAGRLYVVPER